MHDLIIIGAGPAGLSAAIYAVRKKLKTLVLSSDFDGQITKAYSVENYLGLPDISGIDLMEKFLDHTKKFSVEIKSGIKVKDIKKNNDQNFVIETSKEDFLAKAVIIASGKKYRKLDIPGSKEFEGRGITYCATCDAPLYKDKIVAVIGGGDAGQDTANQLSKYAKKIYLINKKEKLAGENHQLQEMLRQNKKIEIINSCQPLEIKGNKFVKSLIYICQKSTEKKEIEIDGIFVEIGSVPISDFAKNLVKLNSLGEIIIDPKTNMTSCPGIFAAGDVTDIPFKQMIIAAGEGAKAALSVYKYLRN